MIQRRRPFHLVLLMGVGVLSPAALALAQTAPAGTQTGYKRDAGPRIESHIAHLHASLRITPAQEGLWQGFAAALRDTVARMDAAYASRQRDRAGAGADAVRDLEAYGAIEDANARNIQLLLPPFRALYDSFSPDQKKTADAIFRRYTDRAARRPD